MRSPLRPPTAVLRLGTRRREVGSAVAATPNGWVIAGTVTRAGFPDEQRPSRDITISFATLSGRIDWTTYLGGTGSDIAVDIAALPEGGFVVVGTTTSATVEGRDNHGRSDVLVARLSSLGRLRWLRLIGGRDLDTAAGVAVSPHGDIIVGGDTDSPSLLGKSVKHVDVFVLRLSGAGATLGLTLLDRSGRGQVSTEIGGDIALSGDDIFVAGARAVSGDFDFFVAAVSADGQPRWVTDFGTERDDLPLSIAANARWIAVAGTTTGELANQGRIRGRSDGFIALLSRSGHRSQIYLVGGDGADGLAGLAFDTAGTLYATGWTSAPGPSTPKANRDVLVVRKDPGHVLETLRLAGPQRDEGASVATGDAEIAVVGSSSSTCFEGQPGHGGLDLVFMRWQRSASASIRRAAPFAANQGASVHSTEPNAGCTTGLIAAFGTGSVADIISRGQRLEVLKVAYHGG